MQLRNKKKKCYWTSTTPVYDTLALLYILFIYYIIIIISFCIGNHSKCECILNNFYCDRFHYTIIMLYGRKNMIQSFPIKLLNVILNKRKIAKKSKNKLKNKIKYFFHKHIKSKPTLKEPNTIYIYIL